MRGVPVRSVKNVRCAGASVRVTLAVVSSITTPPFEVTHHPWCQSFFCGGICAAVAVARPLHDAWFSAFEI